MAFKGGFLLKPTETGVSALANLYLQGKKAIDDKKQAIQSQIRGDMAKLDEATSFTATGIQDYDSMMIGYGKSTRDQAMQDKILFDQGKISLTELNTRGARRLADAKIASQYPNLIKDSLKNTRERVEKGEISALNLELPGFIQDKNSSPYPKNNQYSLGHIGPVSHFINTFQYIEDGERQTNTLTTPISTIVDPNRRMIPKVNLDEDIKAFSGNLGKQDVFVEYDKKQTLADGSVVYGRPKDPKSNEFIKQQIEDRIETYNPEERLDIAYEDLGFRARHHSDFNEDFLIRKSKRKSKSFQDENGNDISFTHKDFIIESDDSGNLTLSEKQQKLVEAHLRSRHYGSLDLSYEEKIVSKDDKEATSKEDLKKISLQASEFKRSSYAALQTEYQQMYNKYANTTGSTLADSDLQTILTKSSTVANGMVIPSELATQMKKDGIKASSFINKPINLISNIAGFKVGDKYYITVLGDTTVGETEATIGGTSAGSISGTATTRDTFRKSMSSVLDNDDLRNLFGYLLRNNDDFASKAEDAGYDAKTTDVAEAMYTIMDMYSLVPAK